MCIIIYYFYCYILIIWNWFVFITVFIVAVKKYYDRNKHFCQLVLCNPRWPVHTLFVLLSSMARILHNAFFILLCGLWLFECGLKKAWDTIISKRLRAYKKSIRRVYFMHVLWDWKRHEASIWIRGNIKMACCNLL